jgi:predicted RNase H-like HicB family nuclease
MQNTYTAIVKQDGDWWVGWIEEVPGVNCQELTKDELMTTLQVTLKEALELNRLEALDAAKSNYHEEMVRI